LVARSKIVLSQRRIGKNGMSCVFFQELPMAASTLYKVMFDETIILQISVKTHTQCSK
jgi:hypothetical protein